MQACKLCKDAFGYHAGLIGKNFFKNGIWFVLHKPDLRTTTNLFGDLTGLGTNDEAYRIALRTSKTGAILDSMLETCSLSWDDIYLTNLFKCCLPGKRKPSREQYEACREGLDRQLDALGSKGVILFGHKPYEVLFPEIKKKFIHERIVGEVLKRNNVPYLIAFHPSRIWAFLDGRRDEHYEAAKDFIEKVMGRC